MHSNATLLLLKSLSQMVFKASLLLKISLKSDENIFNVPVIFSLLSCCHVIIKPYSFTGIRAESVKYFTFGIDSVFHLVLITQQKFLILIKCL